MSRRALLIALMAGLLASLSSLAYASPPDPSWIAGIYDDADFDDVVGLVTSATAAVGPAAPGLLHVSPPGTTPHALRVDALPPRLSADQLHARAPPSS
jgi:hypothetical protein